MAAFKEGVKKTFKYVKDHPILPISTASLGVGAANLAQNKKRYKEADEFQKKQLIAMNSLTSALTGVDNTLKQDLESRSLDNNLNKKTQKSPVLAIAGTKIFSTHEPSPNFVKFDTDISDLSRVREWLYESTLSSSFLEDKKDKTSQIENLLLDYGISEDQITFGKSVDESPINLIYVGNILGIFIHEPDQHETSKIDKVILDLIKENKDTRFKATKILNNSYFLELVVDDNSWALSFLLGLSTQGFKINIL